MRESLGFHDALAFLFKKKRARQETKWMGKYISELHLNFNSSSNSNLNRNCRHHQATENIARFQT